MLLRLLVRGRQLYVAKPISLRNTDRHDHVAGRVLLGPVDRSEATARNRLGANVVPIRHPAIRPLILVGQGRDAVIFPYMS